MQQAQNYCEQGKPTMHALFYSFVPPWQKKKTSTKSAHSKHLIEFKQNVCRSEACAEQYRCDTALCLLSILAQV